jgi:TPR repeat protein
MPRGTMRKRWKQLVNTLVPTFVLVAAISAAHVPTPLQAQSQTTPTGIDAELLAKAKAGDAESQRVVGLAYWKGEGEPRDYAQAADWFRRAAEQGLERAEFDLGLLYENGQGVPQDYARAALWFRKAAEQGDAISQNSLGVLYEDGQGVPKSYTQAAVWLRKAAQQNYAYAQNNLGVLYENGQGVPQDYAQAAEWFRKAAEQGDAEAQDSLARLQHEAENARKPRYVRVTARGVSVVPGAIVCPSYAVVSRMFDLYVSHWEDTTQDALTKGQSRLMRGQPTPAPNLKSYGCALLSPGTPMMLETGNAVPVVTAKLPNGSTIKGVTLPAMIVDQ